MKKRVSLLLTIATILINACNAPNKSEATKSANTIVKIIGDVPFKAANNYFVKNTY